jgi:transposase
MSLIVESEDHLSHARDAGKKVGVRFQAVLALLSGESAEEVQTRFSISRSSLYEYNNRALAAIREALKDKRRGPRHPPNRLPAEKEQAIRSVCERHPTLSSYQVREQLGADTTTPRTIQRVRARLHLPRLNKRPAPSFKAHRFTDNEKRLIRKTSEAKLHLGPYRLAWDLQNLHGLNISPSTIRRNKRAILSERHPRPAPVAWRFYERHHPHRLWHGDFFEKVTLTDEDRTAYQLTLMDDYSRAYAFCDLLRDPSMNDTIRAMIAAMRQYQTIPHGVVFDNGSQFKNEVRGHYALSGKPSISRLQEQDWFALPSVLERLESFARHPLGSTSVELNGCIRLLGRNCYIPRLRYRQMVSLVETLEGLEAETEDELRTWQSTPVITIR